MSAWTMMTRWSTNVSYLGRPLLVLLGTALNPFAPAVAAQSSPSDIADAYVQARRNVMSESASAADVDELLALYDPNVVYEHPSVGIRIGGRTAIRQGTISFLGQTKDPGIQELDRILGEDVVVLHLRVNFQARIEGGWQPAERTQVTTLEISDGLISRIIDYW